MAPSVPERLRRLTDAMECTLTPTTVPMSPIPQAQRLSFTKASAQRRGSRSVHPVLLGTQTLAVEPQ